MTSAARWPSSVGAALFRPALSRSVAARPSARREPLQRSTAARNAMDWAVLPRPMSSARMPPMPDVNCFQSHATPSFW